MPTEQALSLIPSFVPKCLDFLRSYRPLLSHIKVPHDFDCPCIEDLQTLNFRSSLGGFEISHLIDVIHTYIVPSGELSGEIKDVLERYFKANAQVVEGRNGIANGWDSCCGSFSRWREMV